MDGHTPAANGLLSLGACIGPMARTVTDLSLLFSVIAAQFESGRELESDVALLRGLRIAWYADDGVAPVTNETRAVLVATVKALSGAGFEVIEERPSGVTHGSRLWIELFSRAASDQLCDFYEGREHEAGSLVSMQIANAKTKTDLRARISKAENVAAAVLERERLREELLQWMKTTPLILAPVGSTPAFAHGAGRVQVNDESISVFRSFSYAQTFSVFGLPSVVVPAGRSADGLPIGVQIIGRPFEERTVLAVATVIEKALGGWQDPKSSESNL
jgi:Asp-tRNA(Asn)/Glu-tRNA(Gln) amidotransferase A subunit family amidase